MFGFLVHRENAGTLGMVALIINPIYTLYSGYLLGIRALWGVKQLGYHPKGTSIFPMIGQLRTSMKVQNAS